MPLKTKLTELLGIEHPIILAPMGGVSGGALAASVTRAGGFGLIGAGYGDPAWIEHEFAAAGNTPVGIGFITWSLAKQPQLLDLALARKPRTVMLSFGDAEPFARKVKDSGAILICQIQNVKDAKTVARLGADIVVAQGTEAGGHGAGRATFTLVPAVVDAVSPVPVVAAGGIADGRGLAASLMLGAVGALIGTRFSASQESLTHPNLKKRIVESDGDSTTRTKVFDTVRGYTWPHPYDGRAIRNDFLERWNGNDAGLQATMATEGPRYKDAAAQGDTNTMVMFAGENIDLIHDLPPAADIVARISKDAETLLSRPPGLR
ncbi:MAG: nitronate monooxygenase [Alphaproteobacteria bacterium]|nr:nitronate monooxygenase [Alphaproteobacteria bacterium]